MKTVVLITTGQPSINPRVVKEADALQAAGYDVTILYCFWIKWAEEADKDLLKNVKWKHHLVGGSPSTNKIHYFFTRARFKCFKILNKKFGNSFLFAERSEARCFDELLAAAKSIRANWYIGHNLGALPVAVKAAIYNGGVAGFDFEDYHRDENIGDKEAILRRVVFIEEKYIPLINHISTSSPQITERIRQDFPFFKGPLITLLNCFPLTQRPRNRFEKSNSNTLQLFWFSQTIGKNRGLETVVHALEMLRNPSIHLTLVGRCDEELRIFINENAYSVKECIHFAGILPPEALPAFSARFDVGLAIEKNTPINRNICLTNKVFTYLIAGNCILASDTEAQKDFMNKYKEVGFLFKNDDVEDFISKILLLYNERSLLMKCRERAFELATNTLNWENESKKLLESISTLS